MIFPQGADSKQKDALTKLFHLIKGSLAARVGETTVVSTKVHIHDVRRPWEVIALSAADAGEVFYHRKKPREIIHIDVFHSEGLVSPDEVALSVRSALSGLILQSEDGSPCSSLPGLFPYIDVQTGMGGGRMDGNLTYGREEGVLRAHRTHVHVTTLNLPEIVASIFSLVAAVESAVERSGLEIRKIRRVRMALGNSPIDMGDYQATSDSLLRNLSPGEIPKTSSLYYMEALARQAAKDTGTAEDAHNILESLRHGMGSGDFQRYRFIRDKTPEEVRKALVRSNLARYDGQKYTLTQEGEMALSFLKERSMEIESYLRRLLWSLPAKTVPRAERSSPTLEPRDTRGRGIPLPKMPGEPAGGLALPETAVSRGLRCLYPSAPGFVTSSFLPEDLRFSYARERKSTPLMLLIDASASMAGRRIAAAKELARHLIITGRDKVSVVVFQDTDAQVVCDFTRNLRKLEVGLRGVQAQGLTPLARGLEKALELSRRSVKKPLILCITDGIPTVPSKTLSPIDDAMEAAADLAKHSVRLGCIGLEPNQSFLKEMTKKAKGSLYIVDELEASNLAAIAKRESSAIIMR